MDHQEAGAEPRTASRSPSVAVRLRIQRTLNRLGYRVTRIRAPAARETPRRKQPSLDLSLYDRYPAESLAARRFYNIGAGSFAHPYWTNLDYSTDWYGTVQTAFIGYDLMALQPLPIESESAELIYSSHTVEHVSQEAVQNMLEESYRALKPGGGLRITTPDIVLDHAAYRRGDRHYYYWVDMWSRPGRYQQLYKRPPNTETITQLFLHHFASQLCDNDLDDTAPRKYADDEVDEVFDSLPLEEALDYFTSKCRFNPDHPGNHMNWWSHEKMERCLKAAGFTDIYRSGYGQSMFAPMRETRLFDNTHPPISMYMEAVKAG
jgi:predicted SAM-dependent methyltransferase